MLFAKAGLTVGYFSTITAATHWPIAFLEFPTA